MNTRKSRSKFKIFQILLGVGCRSTIVIESLVEKLHPEKYYVVQWHTQAGNITTNIKAKVDFTVPPLSVTNFVTWKYHVDESIKGGYDMILRQHLLTELGFNLKFSYHIIRSDYGPFKGFTEIMVDLGTYEFKNLNTGKHTPE